MSRFPVFTLVLLVALVSTLVQGRLLEDVNVIGAQSNKADDYNPDSAKGLTGLLVGNGVAGSVSVIGAQEDQAEENVVREKTPFGVVEKKTKTSGSPLTTLIDGITP